MSKILDQVEPFVSTQLKDITLLSGESLLIIDQVISVINNNYFKEYGRVVPINKTIPKSRFNKGLNLSTKALGVQLEYTITERSSKLIQSTIILTEIEEMIVLRDLETFVHHSLLEEVLYSIYKSALEHNCKIVIATQSLDVIKASVSCSIKLNNSNYTYHRFYGLGFNVESFNYDQTKEGITKGRDIR